MNSLERKEYMKEYNKKYKITHKKELNRIHKRYRKSSKGKETRMRWYNSPKGRESYKRWTIKHKEYQKLWRESLRGEVWKSIWVHSPKGKASIKRYQQSFKGRVNSKVQAANRKLLTKDLTIKKIQQVYEDNIKQFGTLTCYLCLKPILFGKDTLEHKIPLSRSGNNERSNLAIACQRCNYSKNNKTEDEFKKTHLLI